MPDPFYPILYPKKSQPSLPSRHIVKQARPTARRHPFCAGARITVDLYLLGNAKEAEYAKTAKNILRRKIVNLSRYITDKIRPHRSPHPDNRNHFSQSKYWYYFDSLQFQISNIYYYDKPNRRLDQRTIRQDLLIIAW